MSKSSNVEFILGGFSFNSSDSELSETDPWCEHGSQILQNNDKYSPTSTSTGHRGQNIDYHEGGFNTDPVQIVDMKIDNSDSEIKKENCTATNYKCDSSETEPFVPSKSTTSINVNLTNQLFFKCLLCPKINLRSEKSLRNHINQLHGDLNKTTMTQSTPCGLITLFPQQVQLFTCSICDRRYNTEEFLNLHRQVHIVDGLKCIAFSCNVICQNVVELKSHTNICPLGINYKKETKLRNTTINNINCIFTNCARGFCNDEDFLRHLKSFHGQDPETLSMKFRNVVKYEPEAEAEEKVDIQNALKDEVMDNVDTVSQVIDSVAKGAGVNVNDQKRVMALMEEERKQRYREVHLRKIAKESTKKRATRLAKLRELNRQRAERERKTREINNLKKN